MTQFSRLSFFTCYSVLVLALSACGKNDRIVDLKHYVEQVRSESQKNIKKTYSSFQLPTPITYAALSPSEPIDDNAKKSKIVTTNPLADYALNAFQFLGMIVENNQTFAYILAPDNITYQVKEGDVLGKSKGKIIKIADDHMDVAETYTVMGKSSQQKIITLKSKGSEP